MTVGGNHEDPNYMAYQDYTASIGDKYDFGSTLQPKPQASLGGAEDPFGVVRNRDLFMKAQSNGKQTDWYAKL